MAFKFVTVLCRYGIGTQDCNKNNYFTTKVSFMKGFSRLDLSYGPRISNATDPTTVPQPKLIFRALTYDRFIYGSILFVRT